LEPRCRAIFSSPLSHCQAQRKNVWAAIRRPA
jgi:hypothetical protein